MIAYADEPLRFVVQRMASTGLTKFPVVERSAPGRPIGMIALTDLLKARVAHIESEERREQVLRLPLLFGSEEEKREEPV
jgi:CBS domain containing-hemolysin-like protein